MTTKNNHELIDSLKNALADSYALALKTQNFHWNITGPNFESLHLLFDEQYHDLSEAIDLIAERIRALGAKTPASFSIFNKTTTISDGDENANSVAMLTALSQDQLIIIKTLKTALVCAQKLSDEVTINVIVDRLAVHEKNHWMLHASL